MRMVRVISTARVPGAKGRHQSDEQAFQQVALAGQADIRLVDFAHRQLYSAFSQVNVTAG
jgi:hypothetical protein